MKRGGVVLSAALAVVLFAGSCNQPFGAFLENRALLSFSFTAAANSGDLDADVTGAIGDGTVSLTVPAGTVVTALVPTFIFLGQEVRVGDTAQVSGQASQDFTLPVTYTVVSWDGGTTEYTVTVTVETTDPGEEPVVIPTEPWARSLVSIPMGAETVYATFKDVAVDSDGYVYAVGAQGGSYPNGGQFGYDMDVFAGGSVAQYANAVIVKYAPGGTALWAKTVEGNGDSTFNAVAVDSSGSIYAAGHQYGDGTYSYGVDASVAGSTTAGNNAVLVKYDSDGNALWATSVSGGGPFATAASDFLAVAVSDDTSVYTVGYQDTDVPYTYNGTTVSGNSTGRNAVIVKYNTSGVGVWASSTYTGTTSVANSNSYFEDVATGGNGRVYVAGYQNVDGSENNWIFYYGPDDVADSPGVKNRTCNGMVVAYDGATETALWASSVANATETGDSGYYGVAVDGESLYVAGDVWFDSGTESEPFDFSGEQVANLTGNKTHAILVKYNNLGDAQWVKHPVGSTDSTSFNTVAVDSTGKIYVAGYQMGPNEIDYGDGVSVSGSAAYDPFDSESGKNALLVAYEDTGTALEALSVDGDPSGASEHTAVAIDTVGNIYAAGYASGMEMTPMTYDYDTFLGDTNEVTGANTSGDNIALVKYGPMP